MPEPMNLDPKETAKFGRLGAYWWDPRGPMHSLHSINPLRTKYIAENADVSGRSVLDIGCGGGLLTESLARLGAQVTGIDLSPDLLELARRHAAGQGLQITYREMSAEQLASQQPASFDVVTCMEVLEHIPDPQQVVRACSQLLKPGGHAFYATLDRTLKTFAFAIVGGEYILGLLPVGSHHYRNLIRPEELKAWARAAALKFAGSAGVVYNPLTGKFHVAQHHDMSYMMHFIRE